MTAILASRCSNCQSVRTLLSDKPVNSETKNTFSVKKFKLTWQTLIANHHFLNHPKFSSKEISRNSIWSVPSDFCNFKASCRFRRRSFLLFTFSLSTGWGSVPSLLSNLHNLPSLATQQAICYAFIPSFIGPLQAVCWRLFSFRFGILHASHFGFAWRTLTASITFIWKRSGKLWCFFLRRYNIVQDGEVPPTTA